MPGAASGEQKPKTVKRVFCPQRHAKIPVEKDYKSNVIGLEDKTFNVGKAIHAAHFQKVFKNLAN